MDGKEVIEKKLTHAREEMEKEKVEIRNIQNQSQSLQKKFGFHAVKGKEWESKIEAYEDLLKE